MEDTGAEEAQAQIIEDQRHAFATMPRNGSPAARSNLVLAHRCPSCEPAFPLQPSGELRRDALRRLLAVPLVGSSDAVGFAPGVVVIVPTYGHPSRAASIRATLASIAAQGMELPVRVVVADNGMSAAQAAAVLGWARELGLPADVVAAHPTCDAEKTAGHARNVALEWLHARVSEDPSYRLDALLLLDDDVAMLPRALPEMYAVLRGQARAVAVIPKNIQVPRLDESSWASWCVRQPGPLGSHEAPPHRMPEMMGGHGVDMAAIVAFSGQVATKTNCLLLDAATMHRMLRAGAEPMVSGPHGTAEDMMLSLGLQRLGLVYACPRASVLDREPDSRAVWGQRCQYGRDHVVVHDDLVQLNHAREGIHVLESDGHVWWEWFVPQRGVHGVLVQPDQLSRVSQGLTSQGFEHETLSEPGSAACPSCRIRALGCTPERIYLGVALLERALRTVELHRPVALRRPRPDFPAPVASAPTALRWSDTSRMGQLVGNILGLYDVHGSPGVGLSSFVFGLRQTVEWRLGGQALAGRGARARVEAAA
jgi:glycosyltransferase involved in cell wall biosynthesis